MNKRLDREQAWIDKLNAFGFTFRRPVTVWQDFFHLWFRQSQWARRLLGGKWEAYVHDQGTCHAVITWHWVTKFMKLPHENPKLFTIEDWSNKGGWAV